MTLLNHWANKWGVNPQALQELRNIMGAIETDPLSLNGESEQAVQQRTRLEASRVGCRLWRNNVGAFYDADGNFIRYGLCNESAKLNKAIKSSDLVGIRPLKIEPKHIGAVVGQFVARETKRGGWKYTGSEREKAQLAFIDLVTSLGGDAAFTSSGFSIDDSGNKL